MGDVTHYHGAKSPTDLCQNTPHSSSFLFPSLQTNLFCLNPFLSLPLNSNPALITLFYYILHLCRREDTHAYTHANACIHTAFSGSLSVFIPFYLLSGEKKSFYHTMGNLYPLPAFSILFSTAVTAFGTLVINVI